MKDEWERHKQMKHKFHPVLALLVMLIGLTACSEMAAADAVTTYPADITLIAYTNEDFGISGLAPEGWVENKPGQLQRMPGSDPTLLGQVAFPGVTKEEFISDWQLPDSVGSMKTSNFIWDLYRGELDWPDAGTLAFDFALTESDSAVYLVMLVSLAEENEQLYEGVMAPAIHAITPSTVKEDRAAATSVTHPVEEPVPIDTRIRSADGD